MYISSDTEMSNNKDLNTTILNDIYIIASWREVVLVVYTNVQDNWETWVNLI